MIKNKLLVGILAFVVISGTSSLAFAQSETHSPDANTGGVSASASTPVGASGVGDTTSSFNYCNNPALCHIDFQDPDGIASTFSSTDQLRLFAACPVGEFGNFPSGGAWSHPAIGDPIIRATDCAGETTCWEFNSETNPREISCSAVGGDISPITTSALLLAGAQHSMAWMIPTLIAAAGIGLVVARKL